MNQSEMITAEDFCVHHSISMQFITELCDAGIVEVITIEQVQYIPEEHMLQLEKLARLHNDLDINISGLEAIAHLLRQVEDLQKEVRSLSQRLYIYEQK